MSKTEMIRARVEPELKQEAEAVLGEIGLSPTEAITLFYKQVALHRGLPFAVRIPNAATRRALRDAQSGKGLERFDSVSDWAHRLRSV
jgi:DNA-damage-inducible protein J